MRNEEVFGIVVKLECSTWWYLRPLYSLFGLFSWDLPVLRKVKALAKDRKAEPRKEEHNLSPSCNHVLYQRDLSPQSLEASDPLVLHIEALRFWRLGNRPGARMLRRGSLYQWSFLECVFFFSYTQTQAAA